MCDVASQKQRQKQRQKEILEKDGGGERKALPCIREPSCFRTPLCPRFPERRDTLLFNFEKFSDIAASVYPNTPYSLEDALGVFRYYFEKYEEHTGKPHPPINASQIVRIAQNMPWIEIEDLGSYSADVDPAVYRVLIDKHFATKYRHCDYNINHFFSGRIRRMRWLEEFY